MLIATDTRNYNIVDTVWDLYSYAYNVAIFNSGGNSGNTGNNSGNVRSPGKGLNVITGGNYDDANDTINSSSPFKDPQIGNDKPEITAPGTDIDAGGFEMSGTSQATPHAAAFAADMMSSSNYLQFRPHLVKAKMIAGATDSISGGYDKVGAGGIDFRSAQWNGHWHWWSGGNSSFGYFDSNDGSSDGYISDRVYVSSGWDEVRVALSWLSSGVYSFINRNNAHSIDRDLDLRVYDPNGNYVGGSHSWDNGFERVDFTPTVSGYYTFKVNRFANRFTGMPLRMGLCVNYYDEE